MKKIVMNLAVALVGLLGTTSANATVYFQSDFNGLLESTKSINGGLLTFNAYGEPNNWGLVRNNALTIYGGADYNGAVAAPGGIVGLGADLAAGKNLLEMTGQYRTKANYANVPWNTVGTIEFANRNGWGAYNSIVVNSATPEWTNFSLYLDLAGLGTDVAHIDMVKVVFNITGPNPGELQVDNLRVQTVAAIPEPSVASLLGFGVLGLVATRFRRRS